MKHQFQTKKEAVLKPRRPFPLLMCALIAATAAAAVAVAFYLTGTAGSTARTAEPVSSPAAMVSFPVEQFADGRAQFFEHRSAGLTIRYFILRSADGVLRAAFDACDVCWPAGRGYVQQGDEMVCRNCNRRFASAQVNEVSGGCNPAPLTRSLQEGRLVLNIADIEQGRRYFDFKGGA